MKNFSGMMTFQTRQKGPEIAARMVKSSSAATGNLPGTGYFGFRLELRFWTT